MEAQMDLSVSSGARAELSVERCFEARETYDNDSASYEKSFLDEIDSDWDDIITRLTVSRMVSDSVIKGMVNAVVEEAAERITLKEAELAFTNEKLRYYESDAAKFDLLDSPLFMLKSSARSGSLQASEERNHANQLDRLRIAAEDQLQRIKEEIGNARSTNSLDGVNCCKDGDLCGILPRGDTTEKLRTIDECVDALEVILSATYEQIDDMISPSKASDKENQLKQEIQNLIKGLQDEFETKVGENKGLINVVNLKWQEKTVKLSSLRQELDALSKALCSSESGPSAFHSSVENFEECNTVKRKDNFAGKVAGNHHPSCTSHEEENNPVKPEESSKPIFIDHAHLMLMQQEELVGYFKNEIAKMKRNHELSLQKKTEELFSLKRELLKEKSSRPRDKEFELLKRKVPEFMCKLDDILLENENLPVIHNDQDMLCSLKESIDALFFENRPLHGLLKDKSNEARCFASQVSVDESQLSCYSLGEATLVKQIKKLQSDVEDVKIKTNIVDQINKLVLKEAITELKDCIEGLEASTKTEQDIYSMIYQQVAGDALSSTIPIIEECYQERNSIAARLLEKEKALSSEIKENAILKQEIASLSAMMKEKEKFASEQERFISESKRGSDMMRARLDEALQKIHRYEVEMNGVNQKFKSMSDALDESEKQILILDSKILKEQTALASAITREENQKKWMVTVTNSMTELSNSIVDSESRLADNIKNIESRLKSMKHQCVQLVQQANLLEREKLLYKQRFERRCSDLQKAETEVDLLGDEVDTVLSLLERIHLALDHYSPVLQHYPGVVEVLRLIKREMKGAFAK